VSLYRQATAREGKTMKGHRLKNLRGFFAVLYGVLFWAASLAPAGAQDTIKVAVGQIDAWANQIPTLGMQAGIFQKHGIVLDNYGTHGARGTDADIGIATRTKAKPKKPSQFRVLMLNDDYTPMEFVVIVLKRFFHMDLEQATRVMLHVHQKGVGVCGVFPYEIAETKVTQVMDFARKNQHPLQCTLEKA